MVLYSPESLLRVVGNATAEQMESLIADELPAATEAGVNSEVDIKFNLVHTAEVSFKKGGANQTLTLPNKVNTTVS